MNAIGRPGAGGTGAVSFRTARTGPAGRRALPSRPDAARAAGGGAAHLADLDMLRGVAAVIVVLFHAAGRCGLPALFPRGYLSVDLFFAMSGFVLMHAYGERLRNGAIGFRRFLVVRLIRLMPMIVFGTTLAAVVEIGRPATSEAVHLRDTVTAWLLGSFAIPIFRPTTLEHVVFPLNGPVWSLFFELVASVAFAAVLVRRQGVVALSLVLGASAAWIGLYLSEAHTLNYAGSLASDFAAGFPRVGLSFSLGVALFLLRRRVAVPAIDRRILIVLLVLVCLVPGLPGSWNGLVDALALFVLMPLIVAGATGHGAGTPDRPAAWAGRVSYPLYAIHYPVVRAAGVLLSHHVHSAPLRLLAVLLLAAALLIFATLCDVFFDRPVRARLGARFARA